MKKFLVYLRGRPIARVSLIVLVVLYVVMIGAPFFAPYQSNETHEANSFHPANVELTWRGIKVREYRVIDLTKYDYAKVSDAQCIHNFRLFARGSVYKIAGLIPCSIHLFGSDGGYPAYLLGADNLGRDLFSRIIWGSRISLTIGFVATAVSLALALVLGGVSGYFSGATDWVIMRGAEFFMLIPSLYFILFLRSLLNTRLSSGASYLIITLILSLVGWPGAARTIRGLVLSIKNEDFVVNAKIEGVPSLVILGRHIIPQITSLLIVEVALSIPGFIMSETTLSYLGLGISDPSVSWGSLINRDITTLSNLGRFPWLLWPVFMLLIVTLAFNFVADALRDYFDPYSAMIVAPCANKLSKKSKKVSSKFQDELKNSFQDKFQKNGESTIYTPPSMLESDSSVASGGLSNAGENLSIINNNSPNVGDNLSIVNYNLQDVGDNLSIVNYNAPNISDSLSINGNTLVTGSDIPVADNNLSVADNNLPHTSDDVSRKNTTFQMQDLPSEDATFCAQGLSNADAILCVQDLSVTFYLQRGKDVKKVYAVRNVSFSLHKSELLCIVGESGSGKSVTTQAIPALLPQNAAVSGKVLFKGVDLLSLGKKELNAVRGGQIALIYQESARSFDPLQSISSAFLETYRVKDKNISCKVSDEKALALLSEVGIADASERLKNYPHQFSGGQLQRIAIALALASDAQILIADEITTALDVTTQEQIIKLLLKLKNEHNLSIIFITHNIELVSKIGDTVLVMYGGQVMERGAKNQVLSSPRNPYTRALLKSLVQFGEHYTASPMKSIGGEVFDNTKEMAGCPFWQRCGEKRDGCFDEQKNCCTL